MRTLFVISMLCFCSLLAAVLSLMKKVYQSQYLLERRRRRIETGSVEDGRSSYADKDAEHTSTGQVFHLPPLQRTQLQQSVGDLSPKKEPDWRFMVQQGAPTHAAGELNFAPGRPKGPQPAHFGTHQRLDWAYFNKDLGDLSDPYEPSRFTGTSGAAAFPAHLPKRQP